MTAPQVDPASYTFAPTCELCEKPADVLAQGCMDRIPVAMCNHCLERGLNLVSKVVHLYQKHNRRVMICGDCHRPILTLDTHLEVTQL